MVRDNISQLQGVTDVQVSKDKGTAKVSYDPDTFKPVSLVEGDMGKFEFKIAN